MRAIILFILPVTLSLISCSGGEQYPADQMVNIGTHQLFIHRVGQGTPTVIIDVGIGGRSEDWRPLQERIAEETHVCTYDRAGYGRSEPGPFPRHSGRAADELRALLASASVPGPYVLVGHSLGGLNLQVFADKYPNDVAGMVLLDPPPLSWIKGKTYPKLRSMAHEMTNEWQRIADKGTVPINPEDKERADFFRTIASEHREMMGESAELAAGIESFGDLPLIVIASGKSNPMFGDVAEEYQEYWSEQSRAVAAKSTNGRLVLAEQSSHNIFVDDPDLVVRTILAIVAEYRSR